MQTKAITLLYMMMIPPKKRDELEGEGADYDEIIDVHLTALDDLVNVNSLFTIAVFIGMSIASPNQHSLEIRQECDTGPILSKRLILYEVVSFACFLLSSLLAKSLKVLINLKKIKRKIKRIPKVDRLFKDIKVGKLSCGSDYAQHSVVCLVVIVTTALLLYTPSMLYVVIAIAARD
ncbi:hypothetical protein EZV62_015273 [Acer yangbiense]|uniref:Uncharacterized protein n=1 Tax=Acer yangbiense TaxID=1000413 RepID=A0A5C7HUV9_9ROSI|nr:hypothetical protein EZV62_015273 [Acer yangbiense]